MATISRTGIAGGGTISPAHITNIIDALDGSSSTTTVIASGSFSGSLTGGPVTVSTVTAAGSIQTNGPIIAASLTIDAGNSYGISPDASVSMSFNSLYEDFNTVINHFGGAASTNFTANGISTNNRIIATSFTGSLLGSASYATTASFALNAGGGGSSFPFTGSAIISGSLQITGSLNVSAGIATPQFTINAANTASAGQHLVLDLNLIAKSGGTGQFIIPSVIPSAAPKAGTMYFDDATGVLYIYSVSLSNWQQFVP